MKRYVEMTARRPESHLCVSPQQLVAVRLARMLYDIPLGLRSCLAERRKVIWTIFRIV